MKPETFTTTDGTVITYDGNVTITKPNGDWEPKQGDIVYKLFGDGSITSTTWRDHKDHKSEKDYLAMGNVFRTEELAQNKKDYLIALNTVTKAIKKKNNGWVPDWSDDWSDDGGYYMDYNHTLLTHCVYGFNNNIQSITPYPKCKTREIAEQIIDEYQTELEIIKSYNF